MDGKWAAQQAQKVRRRANLGSLGDSTLSPQSSDLKAEEGKPQDECPYDEKQAQAQAAHDLERAQDLGG